MLIWRVVNNIDAGRDIWFGPFIGIDATTKNMIDGYERQWPGDVVCDRDVIDSLPTRGLIDVDETLLRRFQVTPKE